MWGKTMTDFRVAKRALAQQLLQTEPLHTGSWQRLDTSTSPAHATYELVDVMVKYPVPLSISRLQEEVKPDLPWAEKHFLERIGGVPLNPPPSHKEWPWGSFNGRHMASGQFSHTYPERYWPKRAGWELAIDRVGVRYRYGDLQDVIELLTNERLTRQAYLPVWFPEDTGVHHGERVPCTLGYHFLIRGLTLTCRYYMRSCDIVRHFTNDVYMTSRLMQHIVHRLNLAAGIDDDPISVGQLTMYITSLHGFVGDKVTLEAIARGD
jgi:hypothetical protein